MLWFCTPPGHHPHLPCQRVFWRVFGAVREKGEGGSRSLPTTGSLFPSITMSCREILREVNGLTGLCLDSTEGNSRRQLSRFSAAHPWRPTTACTVVLWSGKALIRKSYSGNVSTQKESPVFTYKILLRASLVAQWLRICLPMQGTRVRALVWEDPTCRGATGPVSHNY